MHFHSIPRSHAGSFLRLAARYCRRRAAKWFSPSSSDTATLPWGCIWHLMNVTTKSVNFYIYSIYLLQFNTSSPTLSEECTSTPKATTSGATATNTLYYELIHIITIYSSQMSQYSSGPSGNQMYRYSNFTTQLELGCHPRLHQHVAGSKSHQYEWNDPAESCGQWFHWHRPSKTQGNKRLGYRLPIVRVGRLRHRRYRILGSIYQWRDWTFSGRPEWCWCWQSLNSSCRCFQTAKYGTSSSPRMDRNCCKAFRKYTSCPQSELPTANYLHWRI